MLLARVSRHAIRIPSACKLKQFGTFRSSLSVARHNTMRVLARKSKPGQDQEMLPDNGEASTHLNGGHSDLAGQLLNNDIAPAVSAAIPVLFKYGDHCMYGEAFAVTGSNSELGSWDPQRAVRMKWEYGDVWMAVISLPAGANTEYKFIKVDANTGDLISWMDDASSPGFNHGTLTVEDGRRTVRGHIAEAFLSIPADYAHLTAQNETLSSESKSSAILGLIEDDEFSDYSDELPTSEEEVEVMQHDSPTPPQLGVIPVASHR